jgi:hypothetical protein
VLNDFVAVDGDVPDPGVLERRLVARVQRRRPGLAAGRIGAARGTGRQAAAS